MSQLYNLHPLQRHTSNLIINNMTKLTAFSMGTLQIVASWYSGIKFRKHTTYDKGGILK